MVFFYYFLTNVFFYFLISFRSVDVKNFQSKFKRAEEQASKINLPGAHSDGDAVNGENIPEWVAIFQQFFEYKKSHPSKSVQEEQRREERRTMQRTILPPVQPLGEHTNIITNETSNSRSRRETSNSLVVDGGTMTVVPVANSTSTTPRPVNTRRISITSVNRRNGGHQVSSNLASNAHFDRAGIIEALNESNRSLFRRSYKEVIEDLDLVKERLVQARNENDHDEVELYNNLRKKLLDELQATN